MSAIDSVSRITWSPRERFAERIGAAAYGTVLVLARPQRHRGVRGGVSGAWRGAGARRGRWRRGSRTSSPSCWPSTSGSASRSTGLQRAARQPRRQPDPDVDRAPGPAPVPRTSRRHRRPDGPQPRDPRRRAAAEPDRRDRGPNQHQLLAHTAPGPSPPSPPAWASPWWRSRWPSATSLVGADDPLWESPGRAAPGRASGAEGATTPEPLRPQDHRGEATLEPQATAGEPTEAAPPGDPRCPTAPPPPRSPIATSARAPRTSSACSPPSAWRPSTS